MEHTDSRMIPAGDFTLVSRDEVYGRRAFGMGTIAFGASDAVVDLKFLGAGDIVGTVRDHEGDIGVRLCLTEPGCR